jgi:hypothetical protein
MVWREAGMLSNARAWPSPNRKHALILGADVSLWFVKLWRPPLVITGLIAVIPMMKSAALQTIEMAVPGSIPGTARDDEANHSTSRLTI